MEYATDDSVFFCSHFFAFVRPFVPSHPRSFHKLALGRGAAADATTEDPVERKFAQIVFRCMMINKEAAVTAARKDSDHIHDTSPPARSSGAAAVADPSLPSTTTSGGGGDAANVATTAWSQQLESMDLD